jgi:hypothetical protein
MGITTSFSTDGQAFERLKGRWSLHTAKTLGPTL